MTPPGPRPPDPSPPDSSAPDSSPPGDVPLAEAWAGLVGRDPALAAVDAHVRDLAWRSLPAGFPGLLRLIVGQQVSTTSADACWARLEGALGAVTAGAVAAAPETVLRSAGFSRQKAAYARALAEAHADGRFDPAAVADLDTDAALAVLIGLKGVGRWTAEAYLMMGEGRLDAWPGGDIALQEAIRWIDRLPVRPDEAAACARAEVWRPYRAVAAHGLWAYYLAVKAGEAPSPARVPLNASPPPETP